MSFTAPPALTDVVCVLRHLRLPVIMGEFSLQNQVALALQNAKIAFTKEAKLGEGCRVDFLTADGIAIEIKRHAGPRTLMQLARYAAFECVTALVLVTQTGLDTLALEKACGKPCDCVSLRAQWGVAL